MSKNTQKITKILKRNGEEQDFTLEKITKAIFKAFEATETGSHEDAKQLASTVEEKAITMCEQSATSEYEKFRRKCPGGTPTVEAIQDLVEEVLMEQEFFHAAKSYIIYRNQHARERERDIFRKRVNLKPAEYPELLEYVDAIRHSYWVHTEFNFTSDIQDFKTNVTEKERSAIKNSMLAIAQIEVAVKAFWGDIHKKLPKPEIASVGYTFAESEVRHQDAYAHLLEILGMNGEFEKMKDLPVINERVEYLNEALAKGRTEDNRDYMQSVLLFSLFVEHVSLFSQFLIIMAFNKHKNYFKGISNVVEATSKEEQIHGLFGIDIINIIKQERPEWFDEANDKLIYDACQEAFEAESHIIDWIYEEGELDFMPSATVKEFVKNRLNNSLNSIGMEKLFEVDEKLVQETDWFDDEVIATKHGDFFVKRSINYNKRSASVTSDDIF